MNHSTSEQIRPQQVPEDAYTESLLVRSYEAGRLGFVSPAIVLRYLEHLATRASAWLGFDHVWYETHNSAWVVREMALELTALPRMDDELQMATWISGFRRVQATREYAVWHPGSGRLAARAQGRWAYIDRRHGSLQRVHDDVLQRLEVKEQAMTQNTIPAASADLPAHELRLTAREYEADSQQHVNNCVYLDWLQEALQLAAAHSGLTSEHLVYPRRYHLEYLRQVLPGDTMRIYTRLERLGSRGLRAWQQIISASSDELAFSARSEHLLLAKSPTATLSPSSYSGEKVGG